LDRDGRWSLSPAFDMVYAHNPSGRWTAQHQMSINGKRAGIAVEDLRRVAEVASLKRGRADAVLAETVEAVKTWPELATQAGIDDARIAQIERADRQAADRPADLNGARLSLDRTGSTVLVSPRPYPATRKGRS
jgi:serine/threonine-protein kinase HipA